jgi:hypothetical protein
VLGKTARAHKPLSKVILPAHLSHAFILNLFKITSLHWFAIQNWHTGFNNWIIRLPLVLFSRSFSFLLVAVRAGKTCLNGQADLKTHQFPCPQFFRSYIGFQQSDRIKCNNCKTEKCVSDPPDRDSDLSFSKVIRIVLSPLEWWIRGGIGMVNGTTNKKCQYT